MTLQEIQTAVNNGKKVFWSSKAYEVKKSNEDWNIVCNSNGHRIGLTWADNITLNAKASDFFTDN